MCAAGGDRQDPKVVVSRIPTRRIAIFAVVTVLSAVLWHLGTGLRPLPLLALLAPLPVLLFAPRSSAGAVFLAGSLSRLGGELQFWPYLTETVAQPVSITAALLGTTALAFGGLAVLYRALVLRGYPGAAVLALPAGWVAVEFLFATTGPFGAWWSIAYTQAAVLPLVQTAALTGPWGITFMILLVPAAVAVLAAANSARRHRFRAAGATTALLVAVLLFGWWRLALPPQQPVRVGLVAVAQPAEYVPVDSPAGREMIGRVVAEVERLADRGARVVVLPEKAWRADDSTLWVLAEPLAEVAIRRDITVVAGLFLTRGERSVNAAIAYPSGVIYAKHYLIPGLEDELTPGDSWQRVPGTTWALAVCFDLDRPNLVRENRNRGATLLLVPALDFSVDYWLHSRMAVLRGVESGLGVARAPQLGELVASDASGRILASARTDIAVTRTVLADIPTPGGRTFYARFGDWFGWLSVLVFAGTCAAAFARRRSPS